MKSIYYVIFGFAVQHSVEICKFSPTIFLQKFRQIKYFTKELSYTVNQFDEKFSQWGKMSEISTLTVCHSVEIPEILSHTFSAKIS